MQTFHKCIESFSKSKWNQINSLLLCVCAQASCTCIRTNTHTTAPIFIPCIWLLWCLPIPFGRLIPFQLPKKVASNGKHKQQHPIHAHYCMNFMFTLCPPLIVITCLFPSMPLPLCLIISRLLWIADSLLSHQKQHLTNSEESHFKLSWKFAVLTNSTTLLYKQTLFFGVLNHSLL